MYDFQVDFPIDPNVFYSPGGLLGATVVAASLFATDPQWAFYHTFYIKKSGDFWAFPKITRGMTDIY